MEKTIKCHNCGKTYTPHSYYDVYCSRECIDQALDKKIQQKQSQNMNINSVKIKPELKIIHKPHIPVKVELNASLMTKKCPKCGKEFQRDYYHPFKTYCSQECQRQSNIIIKKRCKKCQKPFETNQRQRIYCDNCQNKPIIMKCRKCGKNFYSSGKNYCSNECQNQSKLIKLIRTCKTCGKKFKTNYSFPKSYCSQKCRNHPLFRIRINTCRKCGKKFESNNSGKIYCSKECRKASIITTIIKCKKCGKSFSSFNKTKRFCSQECKELSQSKFVIMTKKCQKCGEPFETKNRLRIRCDNCISNFGIEELLLKKKSGHFLLFLIDLENLVEREVNLYYESHQSTFHGTNIGNAKQTIRESLIKDGRIRQFIFEKLIQPLVVDKPYLVWWFGVDTTIEPIKNNDIHFKWCTTSSSIMKQGKPASSDTHLTAIGAEWIAKYSKYIEKVYLGSGDLDCKIILNRCDHYHIPFGLLSHDKDSTHNWYKTNVSEIHYLKN